MANWKTTLAFTLAGIFSVVAQVWPESASWAAPLAASATAIGGKFAQDAND